jgi:hypothetical protein
MARGSGRGRAGSSVCCALAPAHTRSTAVLVMFGTARERTRVEFTSLLSESGFTLRQIVPTQSPVWIIEATPL